MADTATASGVAQAGAAPSYCLLLGSYILAAGNSGSDRIILVVCSYF